MFLVIIKLIEVASRALFIVGATYFLPPGNAGQFGMIVTLASLFTFAVNYERHHDIQRRSVGMAPMNFDRAVKNALPFWGFNMAVVTPIYIAALMLIARMPLDQVLWTLPIAIGEQVSTHAYQMATVERRYNRLVTFVAVKNALVAILAYALFFFADGQFTMTNVIGLWSGIQLFAIAAIIGGWLQIQRAIPAQDAPLHVRLFRQHRESFTHFKIGLVAIGTLQFDRLAAGALLPLADVGIYFRHVLAISFIYQLLSVTFINRITSVIFHSAKVGKRRSVIAERPKWELAVIACLAATGLAAAKLIDVATGEWISSRFSLSWTLFALLLAGAMLRTAADCAAVFCNAWHRERTILHMQVGAFVVGAALLFALTPVIGVAGPAVASLAFSATYLLLILSAVRRMPDRAPHAPTAIPTGADPL